MILEIPRRFTSPQVAKMHIERHHGYWAQDMTTLKQLIRAHAAMHGQGDDDFAKLDGTPLASPVPHVHTDTTEIGVIEL